MSEYLQDPTSRSERSLLRQVESDGLRSRRQPIRGRRQICDPMASCLVNTFLLLHTAPWCIQPVESEKKAAPTSRQPCCGNQPHSNCSLGQKAAENRTCESLLSAHRGPPRGVFFHFRRLIAT